MKKLFCFCLFCSLTLSSFAFSVGDMFIKNSRFWQNQVSVNIISGDTMLAGFNFELTDHKYFDDNIYAFHLPFMLSFPMLDLIFEPFFYPDSGNDALAYGGSVTVKGMIRSNDIENNSSWAYLRASVANQNANISRNANPQKKENFGQFAFEGGLNFNYANLYNFDISGNIFAYQDDVKNITYFGGVMNQRELANLGTIDYVLALPHFSVGGGITWFSTESEAKSFISYKFIDYENDLHAHSVMVNTMIPVQKNLIVTFVYNHLFESHKTNRDLFGIGINYLF